MIAMQVLTPTTIVTGVPPPDFESIMTLKFGEYVQVFEGTTNTGRGRKQGAIALYPSGNLQNGWIFMSLTTGREIHRKQWSHAVLNQVILDRVEDIAIKDKQPLVADNFQFETSVRQRRSIAPPRRNNGGVTSVSASTDEVTRVYDKIDTTLPNESSGPNEESDVKDANTVSSRDTSDGSWKQQIDSLKDKFLNDIERLRVDMDQGIHSASYESDEHSEKSRSENNLEEESDDEGESIESDDDGPIERCDDDTNASRASIDTTEMDDPIDDEDKDDATEPCETESGSTRLRNRSRVDYAKLHRFGETQLLQQHKTLCRRIMKQSGAKGKNKSLKRALRIRTKDTFRKVMGVMLAQLTKGEFDDVNMKEGLKRFG